MAKKNKGLEEDQMIEIDDDECELSEEGSEPESTLHSTSEYTKSAPTPEDTLNLVQGIRTAALSEIAGTMSASEMAVQYADLLKDTAQTANQHLRAQAEAKKGEGSAELAKAIAEANKGVVLKKRTDEPVPAEHTNPSKDMDIEFDDEILDIETSTVNEAPEYEEMMDISDAIEKQKKES